MQVSIPKIYDSIAPIGEDLWNRRGITRPARADRDGRAVLPPTLDEIASPEPLRFYDYAGITDFIYLGEKKILLRTYCSFLEQKRKVKLTAHLKDFENGEYLGSVPLEQADDVSKLGTENEINVGAHNPRALGVVVELDIEDGGLKEKLYLSDPSCIVSEYELNPRYEHIYPKKEPITVIFGNNPGGAQPAPYVREASYIVISLYRVPENAGDSDYVCNFGHGSHGRAILGIPAKGVINFGRSVKVTPKLKHAYASVERKDSGGVSYVVPEQQFQTPIVDNGKIQYEVNPNWKIEVDQSGDLNPFYYDYTLSFSVEYKLNASATVNELKFTVSSKQTTGKSNASELVYPLKMLKIMWGCLAAGTPILTVGGIRKIEDICIGDKVVCAESGEAVSVCNVWRGVEEEMIRLEYGDHTLLLTKTHPVAVIKENEIKYKRAIDIREGDEIKCVDGGERVRKAEAVNYSNFICNLTLDGDAHCFYASGAVVGDMVKENEVL